MLTHFGGSNCYSANFHQSATQHILLDLEPVNQTKICKFITKSSL
uniref:Uncharacterized protein n=1 Tax=Arundo donax TaxID=35708 RepID=A0A0A9FA61_ARUDO